LKAENFELKQRERDYNTLSNKLIELEQHYRALQREKENADSGYKEKESVYWRKHEDLQSELRTFYNTLGAKTKELQDVNSGVQSYKSLVAEKDIELDRLHREKDLRESDNLLLSKENRNLEADLAVIRDGRFDAEKQVDSLALVNERLNKERVLLEDRVKDTTQELFAIRRTFDDTKVRLEIAKRDKANTDSDLVAVLDAKNTNQDEAERQRLINIRLEKENRELTQRVAALLAQLSQAQERYDGSVILLDSREKELGQVRSSLSYSESKTSVAQADLVRARQDNEVLQQYLDKYRKDVDFQKRLREVEAAKKLELETEKQRLEREALVRGAEVRLIQSELVKERDAHGQLLEEKIQTSEEVDALKRHAELLEGQNLELHNELDQFVRTDEVVRKDLDRKPIVDYIKNRNNAELQQSITRLRDSKSPKRSTIRSEYIRSPYKAQY